MQFGIIERIAIGSGDIDDKERTGAAEGTRANQDGENNILGRVRAVKSERAAIVSVNGALPEVRR